MATKKTTPPPSIGRHLVFAAAAGKAVCSRLLEPHGLSLAQWATLVSIWRNGATGVKELAAQTGNAAPATSRIVDRMVQNGLLLRTEDPEDRRAVIIGLTERGEALRPLQTIYEEVNRILLAGFSAEEQALLSGLLDRIERNGGTWLRETQGRNTDDTETETSL